MPTHRIQKSASPSLAVRVFLTTLLLLIAGGLTTLPGLAQDAGTDSFLNRLMDLPRASESQRVYGGDDVPAIDLPAKGRRYVDPVFGTQIKRLSDALNTADNADSGRLPNITPEYATVSPFNSDNSRLLLLHHTYFALYDGAGNYQKDLPFEIHSSSEPRWSRDEPDLFIYVNENSLRSYNVETGKRTTLHQFDEYEKISGLGESDLSPDGEHRVLIGDDREIFVFDIAEGVKSPTLTLPEPGTIDNIHIMPDNQVLVGWYAQGDERFNGVELFNTELEFVRQITPVLGHMDLTLTEDGEPLLLFVNAADPDADPECQNGIIGINLETGAETCLIAFEWGMAMHVSASPEADAFLVSTYANRRDESDEALLYHNEIILVQLGSGERARLAHHRSMPWDNYTYQPKAALSRDARMMVFASNQNRQASEDVPENYTDTYLINTAPFL